MLSFAQYMQDNNTQEKLNEKSISLPDKIKNVDDMWNFMHQLNSALNSTVAVAAKRFLETTKDTCLPDYTAMLTKYNALNKKFSALFESTHVTFRQYRLQEATKVSYPDTIKDENDLHDFLSAVNQIVVRLVVPSEVYKHEKCEKEVNDFKVAWKKLYSHF